MKPDFLEPLQAIAAIHVSQRDNRKAIERVEQQAKLLPQNPYLYHILGGLYELNKEAAKAEDNFKRAIEINPNIAAFYISLGNLYMRQNILDKAIAEHTTAIQKDPKSVSAHMNLGMIYEAKKDYPKAKEYYRSALRINPRFPPAANNLAYLNTEEGGNIDEALALAQEAKRQLPDDPNVSDTIGWVYYKKNIFGRSVAYLREANEKVKENPFLRYHLGMALYKTGEKEQARRELRKALELDPKFPGADEARTTLQLIK
jgi:tetratricopeptide (TPR) repeat protein